MVSGPHSIEEIPWLPEHTAERVDRVFLLQLARNQIPEGVFRNPIIFAVASYRSVYQNFLQIAERNGIDVSAIQREVLQMHQQDGEDL